MHVCPEKDCINFFGCQDCGRTLNAGEIFCFDHISFNKCAVCHCKYQQSREGFVRLKRDATLRYACCWRCRDKLYYLTEYARDHGVPRDVIDLMLVWIIASPPKEAFIQTKIQPYSLEFQKI